MLFPRLASKTSRWRVQVAGIVTLCTAAVLLPTQVSAATGEPEKWELKFGFIKLTDMAPLAVAYEKGFFEDEDLYVTLEAQANWKVLLDRLSPASWMAPICLQANHWARRLALAPRPM